MFITGDLTKDLILVLVSGLACAYVTQDKQDQ